MPLVALRPNPSRTPVASSDSIPPPVGGLNARDELAKMDPRDALVLDNFFPEPSNVSIRKGYASHATGMSGQIRTLMEYAGPTSRKLFAAISTAIYNVTSSGAVGAAELSSLSSGDWQHVQIATTAGNFLVLANGADSVRNYDGSSWTTPSITGVTSSDLISVCVHKKRLWFVEKNTTNAWYLGTEAIAGAASKFALGAQFKAGGKLVAIGTWTRDAGAGPDDYAVFISSMGEAAIYAGTDPASGTTWEIVGVFKVGAPVGNRCLLNIGADLVIITINGAVSLATMVGLDQAQSGQAAITDKINKLFNTDARAHSSNFGWQGILYPKGNMGIFNVPTSTGVSQIQYVFNTITGSWCRFTGMNAGCWGLLSDNLYFGGNDGVVYLADSGYQDNGGGIIGSMKTAFNYFKSRGRIKAFKMVRPLLSSSGNPSFLMGLNTDFADSTPTDAPTTAEITGSLWGAAVWGTDIWAGTTEISKDWQGVAGVGMCAAIRLNVTANGVSCAVNSFDILYETGGVL